MAPGGGPTASRSRPEARDGRPPARAVALVVPTRGRPAALAPPGRPLVRGEQRAGRPPRDRLLCRHDAAVVPECDADTGGQPDLLRRRPTGPAEVARHRYRRRPRAAAGARADADPGAARVRLV